MVLSRELVTGGKPTAPCGGCELRPDSPGAGGRKPGPPRLRTPGWSTVSATLSAWHGEVAFPGPVRCGVPWACAAGTWALLPSPGSVGPPTAVVSGHSELRGMSWLMGPSTDAGTFLCLSSIHSECWEYLPFQFYTLPSGLSKGLLLHGSSPSSVFCSGYF